ncbi:hypothetical protein Tco_0629893 [Tanacetum coccineum]|uniref:Uncharacterized protein n=1 Tax=Tanacetum coccineum TaxID=301880 RepID=A0ABQ4WUE6_9ASTR
MFDIGGCKAPRPSTLILSSKKLGLWWAMRGYNRKSGAKRLAMKIDIAKASDISGWSYLENTLNKFGFHKRMAKWIMTCVSTATFTVNVNGERHGIVKEWSAKIALKEVCKPKSQGGLGLKLLGPWNETLLIKHICNIANMKETLWVKWVHAVKLIGTIHWDIDHDEYFNMSWPDGWCKRYLMLDNIHVPFLKANEDDKVQLMCNGGMLSGSLKTTQALPPSIQASTSGVNELMHALYKKNSSASTSRASTNEDYSGSRKGWGNNENLDDYSE